MLRVGQGSAKELVGLRYPLPVGGTLDVLVRYALEPVLGLGEVLYPIAQEGYWQAFKVQFFHHDSCFWCRELDAKVAQALEEVGRILEEVADWLRRAREAYWAEVARLLEEEKEYVREIQERALAHRVRGI